MGALTPDLELRLRTERHVAELKAAHREHEGREGLVANNRGAQIGARATD
jgi:hypothetical protein